jgi:hypothetical protein
MRGPRHWFKDAAYDRWLFKELVAWAVCHTRMIRDGTIRCRRLTIGVTDSANDSWYDAVSHVAEASGGWKKSAEHHLSRLLPARLAMQ